MSDPQSSSKQRLVKVTLDEGSIGRSSADIEHERAVAIYDLLEDNSFAPVDHDGGPYVRHRPPPPAQRRLRAFDGAAEGEDRRRLRHRAPPVHADLRVALERLRMARAARPQAVLFACGMNSVRSPMAAALFKHYFGRTY